MVRDLYRAKRDFSRLNFRNTAMTLEAARGTYGRAHVRMSLASRSTFPNALDGAEDESPEGRCFSPHTPFSTVATGERR